MDFNSFGGGFDGVSDGGVSGAEVSQEALEQFREQSRKTAAQAKRDQKAEQKRKQQDTALARIIVQFLQTPRFSGFFLVVSRALSSNIPSDFLLAVLSLIHKEAFDEIVKKEFPKIEDSENLLLEKFPPQFLIPLQQWNKMIISVGTAAPQEVLESVLDDAWNIDLNIPQLMALVLREYFLFQKFEVPFEGIHTFSQAFITALVDRLEKQVSGQGLIEGGEE